MSDAPESMSFLPLPRPILVAGMGNVLHGDDGFGPRVVELLRSEGVPDDIRLIDVGIGGIHLVQELMEGYATLLLLDAVDDGREPGVIRVLQPTVPTAEDFAEKNEHFFAETHYAVPAKALVLARALSVLPERVYIVGCQPLDTGLGMEITETMSRAVTAGAARIRQMLDIAPVSTPSTEGGPMRDSIEGVP